MSVAAEVKLCGSRIGVVLLEDGDRNALFQYDPEFIASGIEVAPLMMPLSTNTYRFPGLSWETFHGLPGLLADSLPDKFGNSLIDKWLTEQGRQDGYSFTAIERLCYTGTRGMGALEFEPAIGPDSTISESLNVEQLVDIASKILLDREDFKTKFSTKNDSDAMMQILQVGTSAGGARAKAVIAWNPKTNEVRSGQIAVGDGFEYWLIKFDGVHNNRDRELADPRGDGAIEYAYYHMAKDCGVIMNECRLFNEGDRRHFMTKRFDRLPNGDKLHMQSLAAMAHLDFSMPGIHSYEQVFGIMRRLDLPTKMMIQMFRRMVFNIVARNHDDHVKNTAFLMDRQGVWSLAPAFDITYSYQKSGRWTSSHQMTLGGKRDGFTMDDFIGCGKTALLRRGQAKNIVDEIRSIVSRWRYYADASNVIAARRNEIQNALRLKSFH